MNYCVICGKVIPEGQLACPRCEKRVEKQHKLIEKTKRELSSALKAQKRNKET